MTQPDPPPVASVEPQQSLLEPTSTLPIVLDAMGRYVQSDGSLIEEGVCRDCGRLLYRVLRGGEVADVWHPRTVLSGDATARFDGTAVTSPRGECAGAAGRTSGRPDPTAFVIGVPLVPLDYDGTPGTLPCYICGDPLDHYVRPDVHDPCPSELDRAGADRLRGLVGLDAIEHERRRDDRV